VIAVASGKGGVGKTNLTANLAVALAHHGLRVWVLDADLGLANLDLVLGVRTTHTLESVLRGERRLADVVARDRRAFACCRRRAASAELTALSAAQQLQILDEIDALDGEVDVLLIDVAAGLSSNVLYFAAAASETLVVTTPEPTAIADAYALVKVLSTRWGRTTFPVVVNMAATPIDADAASSGSQASRASSSRCVSSSRLDPGGRRRAARGARTDAARHDGARLAGGRAIAALADRLGAGTPVCRPAASSSSSAPARRGGRLSMASTGYTDLGARQGADADRRGAPTTAAAGNREEILRRYLPLVRRVVQRLAVRKPPHIELDDPRLVGHRRSARRDREVRSEEGGALLDVRAVPHSGRHPRSPALARLGAAQRPPEGGAHREGLARARGSARPAATEEEIATELDLTLAQYQELLGKVGR
jgi:MinD-like ATPase involved in chromosome partitioning or flagellar assembly